MSPQTSFAIRFSFAMSALAIVGWYVGASFNDEIEDLFLS